MSQESRKSNRGPAAAAENRSALLEAARRLFAEEGYGIAMSRIAREAGVSQGVLYRHFPTKLELALAVFEEHFQQYEEIVAEPDSTTFFTLWETIALHLVEQTAFIEMAIDARETIGTYDGIERMLDLVRVPLELAQRAGTLAPDITTEDVLIAIRMAYGLVRTAAPEVSPHDLHRTVLEAFPHLRPS